MAACLACGKAHRPDQPCAAPTEGRIGQVVGGKYRVVRHIGEGGMASVYEAQHIEIRRSFALKFLHPWLCEDEEWLERFRREASAGGALISEHITAIVDIGTAEGDTPYIVMEYLAGEDLGQRLGREFSLKPIDAIEIVSQACCGLGVAHAAGVIHRDLKPENLFLCERQLGGTVVKILDFGIAKLKNAQLAQVTRAGMVIGTPFYMSPEQAVGRADVDHRSDIYALGVILYELLSGEKPFVGDNHNGVLNQIIAAPPPSLQDHCPTVSAELAAVVERAISKSPADRFQNAAEFAEALTAFSPQGRRSSRTSSGFASRGSWRAVGALSQPTVAEPNLTVRVTGSSKKVSLPDASDAAENFPNEVAYTTQSGAADLPEFDDATDAQLSGPERESNVPIHASGEATLDLPSTAVASHEEELTLLGAPPTSRSRVRQHAGRFEAAHAHPEGATLVRSDRTPLPLSVKTVSLRRTLAPVVVGLLAIVLIVLGVTSGAEDASVASPLTASSTNFSLGVDSAAGGREPLAAELPSEQSGAAEAQSHGAGLGQGAVTSAAGSIDLTDPGQPADAPSATASSSDAEAAFGTLSVQSEPSARVFIAGKPRGRTPLRGLRLPVGEYRLRLDSSNHGKRFKTVRVFPQQLTAVNVRFDDSTKALPTASPAASDSATPTGEKEPKPRDTTAAPAARNCSPRWLVDAQGVRRVKPECLLE